jgi:hypothetical protein
MLTLVELSDRIQRIVEDHVRNRSTSDMLVADLMKTIILYGAEQYEDGERTGVRMVQGTDHRQ